MWRVSRTRSVYSLPKFVSRWAFSTTTPARESAVMAIRREDINVWERRAPISPAHVKEIVDKGIEVLVQPSTRRAYTMSEYEAAGAVITEDLSPASLIIGVKAVPINVLLADKTYAFFSHTIKAQPANMPLLDAMLEKVGICICQVSRLHSVLRMLIHMWRTLVQKCKKSFAKQLMAIHHSFSKYNDGF